MRFYLALIFLTLSFNSLAQDERFFREMYTGDLKKGESSDSSVGSKIIYKWQVNTPFYEIDLDGDGKKEALVLEKKDGENWFHVHGSHNEHIFRYQLETKGNEARAFKVRVRNLSNNTKVLVVHFYEGWSRYQEFTGTARLYFFTIDNRDLSTLKGHQGPSFFDEREDFKGHYHLRMYEYTFYDYNDDGIKEIVVKFHNSSQVFMYKGKGEWLTI